MQVTLILKALVAALSVGCGIGAGILWSMIERACEPFHPQDVRFYLNLYTDIGAASGFLLWYIATLVNRRHVRLGSALLVLAIPFFLIFLLSQSEETRSRHTLSWCSFCWQPSHRVWLQSDSGSRMCLTAETA